MGNATMKRPRPTGKVGPVWQPSSTRIGRLRRADTVRQSDQGGDAWLPKELRQHPTQSARSFLRDFGLCGGSAVVLFSLFVLIAVVTADSNTGLSLCRVPSLPSARECPRQPLSSLLPAELDPTSELYADAIKYMQPELHLQHAKVYTAKIRDFVDHAPMSKAGVRAKQAALYNIVESHDKFAHEVVANKHYPFDNDTMQRLAERMLENLYTLKQFEQQVADTKLVQPGINISADKILQKLNLVPT